MTKIVKRKKPAQEGLATTRQALQLFFTAREDSKRLKEGCDHQQPDLVDILKRVDPDNGGIVYDTDNEAKGTAYVQQNQDGEGWNVEECIEFCKNAGLWKNVTSKVFDIQKFESEVANGNISKKQAKQLRVTVPAAKPFIRFGKKGDQSL